MTFNWLTNPYVLLPLLNVVALLWFIVSRVELPSRRVTPGADATTATAQQAESAPAPAAATFGSTESQLAEEPAAPERDLDFDSIDGGEILPLESVFSRLQERVEKQTRKKVPTRQPLRPGMQLEQVL